METGRDGMTSTYLEPTKKKELFTHAMEGNWEAVVKMYEENPRVHEAKITWPGDTALHIAVYDGKEEVVKQMVDLICTRQAQNRKKVLGIPNLRGNSALHLAASMGNARMCEIIASVERSLVDCRNHEGETPLFLAALHGKKQAFLCLHYIRNPGPMSSLYYPSCRRKDGDTFLHCAINGDYFDLAFQIIHMYQDLVMSLNEGGLSPLHLLAAKPSAFRSGCRMGRIETIIYRSIFVEKLEVADPERLQFKYQNHSPSYDYPENYKTCWDILRFIKTVVTAIGEKAEADPEMPTGGSDELWKIHRMKENHTWSVQIVNELLCRSSLYEYEDERRRRYDVKVHVFRDASSVNEHEDNSRQPQYDDEGYGHRRRRRRKETPILMAAKNGVMEIIEKTLELFPVAIYDLNEEKKNMVLLAVEHRQPYVYQFLLKKNIYKESLFRQVDNEGNSALHLAAKLGVCEPYLHRGEALQMQWEVKWYQFVKASTSPDFFARYNKKYETPDDIFTETHKELVKSSGDWLNKASESCSVVAALIATVAFATAATLPGGVDQGTGRPTLESKLAFKVFAYSSLMALCSSITAVVVFLSILVSRFQETDFNKVVPRKLILGLSSLFMSIASMLASFCAGHFFVLQDQLHYAVIPIYLVTCLPGTLLGLAQFPLYFDLLGLSFKRVPERSQRAIPATRQL